MAVSEQSGGRDSVNGSIMGFAQPEFVSAKMYKAGILHQWSFSYTHSVILGRGISYRRILRLIFFAVCTLHLLFSFSACPIVHLSGARANYYGNEWNGYQILFFLLHFTHPHICWCLHLLECWDEVFFFVPFCLISTAALTSPRPHPHSNRNFRQKFVLFIFTATARICRSDRDCVSGAAAGSAFFFLFFILSHCSVFLPWRNERFMWRWLWSPRHPVTCFIKRVRNAQGGQWGQRSGVF